MLHTIGVRSRGNMILLVLVSLILTLLTIFYYVSRRKYGYWKNKNVPYLEPTTFLGNYGEYLLMQKYFGKVAQEILQKYPNEPYVGAYFGTEPVLILQDPEIIKLVTTKDFYYFHGREISKYTDREVTTRNLFFEAGDKWKVTRQNLTPIFSSAKMKQMFPLIENCSIEFEKIINDEFGKSSQIEIQKLCSRFTMACICSCAFGVDVDTLGTDVQKNPFLRAGNDIFETSYKRGIITVARTIWPAVFYGLGLTRFPNKVVDFFDSFLMKVFEGRHYKPSPRNDFIDMMLQLKENKYISGDSILATKRGESGHSRIQIPVTDKFVIAQCMVFFAAGFETSATTLQYTMFELAKHPEAQKKAQEEVDRFLKKHNNKMVYECVTDLPYVDMCIDETLRLYPVLGVLSREVMEDYTVPNGLKLDKGVRVQLPVYHLHRNPKFFPEPDVFRPERFSPEERRNIIPHSYIPFGDGARLCIGMRFAKMQMLAGVVTLLKKYNVELAEGMSKTLEFDPRPIVTQPRSMLTLKFTPREGFEERVFVQ